MKMIGLRYGAVLSTILFAVLLISSCSESKELRKAKEFLDAGMFDQAIILLKQEVQSDPKNAEAHLLLGISYIGSGADALAEQELNTAIVLDNSLTKEAAKRCYALAKYLAKTDRSKAHTVLIKARDYDLSLENDEMFFFLAYIDTEEDDITRTEAAKKYVVLFPSGQNSAQVTYQLAESLLAHGDRAQAKIYFTQVVSNYAGTELASKASDKLAHWADTITPIKPIPVTATPNCVLSYTSGSCWTVDPSTVRTCSEIDPLRPSVGISQDGLSCSLVVPGNAARGVKAEDNSGHQFLLRRGEWFEIQAEGLIRFTYNLCGGPEGIAGWYDPYADSPFKQNVGGLEFSIGELEANRALAGSHYRAKAEADGVPTFRIINRLSVYNESYGGGFRVSIRKIQ